MDRLLRQQLEAIARDRRSGAAQLALRAVTDLQSWLRRHPKPTEQELLDIARALLHAQPSMAPLLRLANDVALAADAEDASRAFPFSLSQLHKALVSAPGKIANHFWRALPRHPDRFMTYSYSSTVLKALVRARSRIRIVYCSESRPGYEGRTMASKLARAGIWVCLKTDAALFSMAPFGHLVLGADKVLRNGFENKIGTDVLVERAHRGAIKGHMRKMRFWVLADTTKFWPESVNAMSPFWKLIQGPHAEVWKEAPKGLWVSNNYFCGVRFFSPMRILTERGWMTPKQVRGYLKNIRISPRLKELAN